MSTVFQGGVVAPGGTLFRWARAYKRYLDVVISAVGTRPDWQLIAACGPFAEAFDIRKLPENVQVFERVPQIEVLEKAALAITPAGAGTVRECASLGVPMLAFPMWYDQYGNAARIQHAGMGLNGGNFAKLDEGKLLRLIDRILHDDAIESAVLAFRENQVVDRETEWQEFREFIEEHTGLRL
jgi:UDP:flavonoid glycosyltransferase YjiC (YdhE family)